MRLAVQLLGLLVFSLVASAHDARPIYVQMTETTPGQFDVTWKIPASYAGPELPRPTLPANCVSEREAAWQRSGDGFRGHQSYECTQSLSGREVGIDYPGVNPSLSTLLEIAFLNGEKHMHILRPDERRWRVPATESGFAVATQYTRLGIEHIWLGLDHLLFVACFVFIARTPGRLLITVTGFTIAHSLTLILSALKLVNPAVLPVEAAIALSVVFLAWELARHDQSSLTYRYPIVVAAAFGLLHGFGFAAVLRDIGLPQTELITALLFFNVGVEIGQILFVAVLVVIYLLLRGILDKRFANRVIPMHQIRSVRMVASYAVGSVASFWMIERIASFWS